MFDEEFPGSIRKSSALDQRAALSRLCPLRPLLKLVRRCVRIDRKDSVHCTKAADCFARVNKCFLITRRNSHSTSLISRRHSLHHYKGLALYVCRKFLQPLSLIALVHVRNAIISVRRNDCKRNLACATISKKKRYAVTQTVMLNHWRDRFSIASAQLEKNDPIKTRRSRSDRKRSPYVSRYRSVFVILGQLLVD